MPTKVKPKKIEMIPAKCPYCDKAHKVPDNREYTTRMPRVACGACLGRKRVSEETLYKLGA